MTRPRIAAIIVALALAGAPWPAGAQVFLDGGGSNVGNIEGFTVTGKGQVKAKPNRLEIDLEVSAASELSADAIVKYRDARQRLQDAFAALKLPNVAVEERGLLVDQKGQQFNPYFGFDMGPQRKARVEVELTRKLVITCSNIRTMDEDSLLQLVAKLLDVAQDAGGKIGGDDNFARYYYYGPRQKTGLVRFILDDYDKIEDEAYAKAMAEAEARAQRLAKLSRVSLGPVSAVRELSTPRDRVVFQPQQQDDEPPPKRLESSRFQEIAVKVDLLVRFDAAGSRGGARTGGSP